MESVNEEARRRLQLRQEAVKRHQTDVRDQMEECKGSLRNLETEYSHLIELIHKHRDEQVSGSCLLNMPTFKISRDTVVQEIFSSTIFAL